MRFSVLSVLAALLISLTACGGGTSGAIEVEDARFRLSRADLGAGYLTVTNSTDETVTLESVSAAGVGSIELHESLEAADGTMAMEARPEGFEIGAGETMTLEPGGKHLMLFDPEGTDDLNLVLDFGDQSIEVVAAFDEAASASLDSMDHSDHDEHSDHGDDHSDHSDHGDEEADHGDHDEHSGHSDDDDHDDDHGDDG